MGSDSGFASSPDAYGVDLLANFRSQPGATHLGATVTRIRGYVWPDAVGGEAPANPYLAGAIGFRIDAWNEDPLDVDNNPFAQPDEDTTVLSVQTCGRRLPGTHRPLPTP